MRKLLLLSLILLAGCSEMSKDIGRGAALERGPLAKVWPKGATARVERHGRWRGMDPGDRLVWEQRYTRGLPTGPYRQWNAEGQLIATWPYNWDGKIEGWALWYENGVEVFKKEIQPDAQPDFDPIGQAARLRRWAEGLAQ